jgi:RNA polymerase sigma factor (sigma-70 family)
MSRSAVPTCVRHLRGLLTEQRCRDESDEQLLHTFVMRREESAFAILVRRHGPMVFNVCRRVLGHVQDAEDAFQATFLVLARKAASLRKRTALASWLHGIAYRTALKAKQSAARRRKYEAQASPQPVDNPSSELLWREVQTLLDEEIARLPDVYRNVFVLCHLESLSRAETARRLGVKEGTVSSRLAEARKRLQQRLARRGLTLAAALCAGAWTAEATAAMSCTLMRTAIHAAIEVAAGQTVASVVSAPVAALVEGATQTLFASKVKLAAILLVVAGLVTVGVGSQLHRAFATPAREEKPATAPAPKIDKAKSEKPAAAKDEQLTVHGRVLDPEGKPLEGARVFLPGAVWGGAKGKEPLVDVKSDAEGQFHFTIDRSQLVRGRSLAVTAKGHALDWIEAEKLGPGEITLRLVKDMPIAGRVLDLEGRPVKGVRVSVRRIAASAEGDLTPILKSIQRDGNRVFTHPLRECYLAAEAPIVAPVTTDDAGRFRFTGLGKERLVVLWVEGPTIEHQVLYVLTRPELDVKKVVQSAPDRLMFGGRSKTPLPAIYGPTFNHMAGPTRPVVGVVRDHATGKPVADVSINGSASGWWENYVMAKTDKEGRYRLIGLPKAPSYRITAYGVNQDYLPAGQSVGGKEGLGPITLDFELVHGIRVRGRITDKGTGQPVNAALWYVPLADNKYFAKIPGKDWYRFTSEGHRTEKDGSFSLLALPGSGLIKVRAEVGGENPYTQAVIARADEPKAYSTKDEGLGQTFLGAGGAIETLSGHNAYRLIAPEPDTKSITCDIQLERGQARTGRVVDPDGKPLTGVRVFGLGANGGVKMLADSTFKAVSLNPAKPRLLTFIHKERKLVGHVLVGADAKEPVTVRLQPGAVLTGRLLDEDGKPLAGITVSAGYRTNEARWLADEAFADRPVKTDAEGRFRVEGIFPDLKFGLGLRTGKGFLIAEEKYQELTLTAGVKALGDIVAKPFRPE